MEVSYHTQAGSMVVNNPDAFSPFRTLLEMVELTLKRAELTVEFVDVEPYRDGGIRFSMRINGEEY